MLTGLGAICLCGSKILKAQTCIHSYIKFKLDGKKSPSDFKGLPCLLRLGPSLSKNY